ncbi:MAG TPA: aminotransferase class III-fold pyridoxal phosphate-dependent enzyme [Polyangiaceae bacterium LLY-WYZ-15_(1-7)]|nr:aminotransferase class III-fold pyridoxal phosphate-dependent enzyme [Polyangiaceae bacterium LLY-WYZ-15_(1-7)]
MSDEPFFLTWQAQAGGAATELRGGDGVWMDTGAGRVLDLGALVYQANAGHGHRRIVEAVKAQADALCLAPPNAVYPAKRALAEALLAKAPPGFSKVFFCLGGSDANENAMKIARMVTGRHKCVARYRSYHGATLGASTLSGDWRRAPIEPALPGVVHVMDLDEGVEGTQIPRVLALEEQVGAVFLESVVGANGVLIPPPGYYEAVRAACDAHGALWVADEVLVGFGRTGRYWGFEHWGATPDLISCGKALTGGYGTLGAVLVHERVARVFEEKVLACGLTHYAHPLGVAAALEALRVYDDEGLVAKAAALEAPLKAGLEGLPARVGEAAGAVRGIGALGYLGLDLDEAGLGRLRAALASKRVHVHVKGPRQLRGSGGALVVSPPLCITEAELDEGLGRVAEALDEVVG